MTTLIVGGGVSGLAFAGFLHDQSECLLIEKDNELGGVLPYDLPRRIYVGLFRPFFPFPQ